MVRYYKKIFLSEDGEYVLFGDEKQNVYSRVLEKDRKPKTNVIGNWNILNESFRLSSDLAHIAIQFQNKFFRKKYDIDNIKVVDIQRSIWDTQNYIDYIYTNNLDYEKLHVKITNILRSMSKHPNDTCFIATKIETLRNMDYVIRKNSNKNLNDNLSEELKVTKIAFETREQYEELKRNCKSEKAREKLAKKKQEIQNKYILKLEEIRRNKKNNFWMNSGLIKLCTIHSFKGWEIDTLILLIDGEGADAEELIYTGLTRALRNLIIVNVGNKKYDKFFRKISDVNIDNFAPVNRI